MLYLPGKLGRINWPAYPNNPSPRNAGMWFDKHTISWPSYSLSDRGSTSCWKALLFLEGKWRRTSVRGELPSGAWARNTGNKTRYKIWGNQVFVDFLKLLLYRGAQFGASNVWGHSWSCRFLFILIHTTLCFYRYAVSLNCRGQGERH